MRRVREAEEGERRDMLLQAYEMRALLILFDGVDEASDRKEQVEDFVVRVLAKHGFRIVVTSRPEGVRAELYRSGWVVLSLAALREKQQHDCVTQQLQGDEVSAHQPP